MDLTPRNIIAFIFSIYIIASGKLKKSIKKALKGDYILSIYFHNPTKKEFESIVKWLRKRGFHFISLSDLNKIATKEAPFPKGAVLITVDDGWRTNKTNIVEVANDYQIPITIFVSTGPAEEGAYWWSYAREAIKRGLQLPSVAELKKLPNDKRLDTIDNIKKKITLEREALTPLEVKEISLSNFITIGGHTHTHPILVNCSNECVNRELNLSKDKLASWTGKEVEFFAYPNGDFSLREIEILKKLDYKLGFANNAQYLTIEILDNNLYAIPRFGFLEGASFAENICRVVGVWKRRNKP